MEELIMKLIELVQQTAPELWRIAIRQVYGSTIVNSFWLLIPVCFGLGCKKIINYFKEDEGKNSDWVDISFIGWVGLVVAAGFFVGILADIFIKLFNPEYYAIQVLFDLVK